MLLKERVYSTLTESGRGRISIPGRLEPSIMRRRWINSQSIGSLSRKLKARNLKRWFCTHIFCLHQSKDSGWIRVCVTLSRNELQFTDRRIARKLHGDLFLLPGKIRFMIYRLVFRQEGYIRMKGQNRCDSKACGRTKDGSCGDTKFNKKSISTRGGYPSKYHNLLLTQRYIYLEAIGVYYHINKFMFNCTCQLYRFWKSSPRDAFQHLRWVQLILEGKNRVKAIQALAGLDELEVCHIVLTDHSMEFEIFEPSTVVELRRMRGLGWAQVEVMKNIFDKMEDKKYMERQAVGLESLMYDYCVSKTKKEVSTSYATAKLSSSQWIAWPQDQDHHREIATSQKVGYHQRLISRERRYRL
jgi:hypothetical protein